MPDLAPVRPTIRYRRAPTRDDYAEAVAVAVTLAGIAGWLAALARLLA